MAEEIEKIAAVDKIGRGTKAPKITPPSEDVTRVAPNKDYFEALMQQKPKQVEAIGQMDPATKPSIFDQMRDLNHHVDQVTHLSPKDLAVQSEKVIAQIQEVKNHLQTPNLELKGSVQTLLQNKLTHIDENLRVALSKAGIEYQVPPVQTAAPSNPIDRFLGFLTDGQYQLQHLSDDLTSMGLSKGNLNPANMLAIQIKVGYVQQELEFFTSLLNKALESTKTIMNVQV